MSGRSLIPRNRYLLVVALIVLALGGLQVVGILRLPFGSWFGSFGGSILSPSTLVNFMSKYGYLSLFVLMAVESASLPVPSEVVLPLAGFLVSIGVMDFWAAVIVSTAASLTGALIDYYLARWLGRPFVVRFLKAARLHTTAL